MMSAIRNLMTVLVVAAGMSMPAAPGIAISARLSGASAGQAQIGDRAKLVGTYALITTEVKDAATGTWSTTPNFNSIGYITYSDTGHMGVHIMPKIRQKFAANIPTGEEAQAALRGTPRPAPRTSSTPRQAT